MIDPDYFMFAMEMKSLIREALKQPDMEDNKQKVIDRAKEILLKYLVDGAHKEQPKRTRKEIEREFIEAVDDDEEKVFSAILSAMKDYACVVAVASLKEAAENGDVKFNGHYYVIDKSSITNEKNIKLL